MKKLILLLALSGCQITIAKLPEPAPSDVVEALKQHAQMLDVLAKDYQSRNEVKGKK
jgi:hypothetical protein